MRGSDVAARERARTFNSEGARPEVPHCSELGRPKRHSYDSVVLEKRYGHWVSAANLVFWIDGWWLRSLYQMKKTQEGRP